MLQRSYLLEVIKDEFYEDGVLLQYLPINRTLQCSISGLDIFSIQDVDIDNNNDFKKCLTVLLDYGNYQDIMGNYILYL